MTTMLDLLSDLVAKAKRAGADAADALAVDSQSVSYGVRLGKLEKLERSESTDLGLRVLIGKRQAVVSTSERGGAKLDELVQRAIDMARIAPEDPYCGLADPGEIARDFPDLDLDDPVEPPIELIEARARAAEDAAMAVAGVTNSEGGEADWSRSVMALVASNGFARAYARSSHSVVASVIAGEGTGMERDYDYSAVLHGADLMDPAAVGRSAGERAVRRLNPRKAASQKVPVVFDPRVAGGIVRHLSGAINGQSIARGTSFLRDKMGHQLFPKTITIIDDPFRKRGLGSRPVDGEGIAPVTRPIIDRGQLTTWLLDLRSARQLGLKSTGHAARGTTSPPNPAPTNLYLEPGAQSPHELIKDVGTGLYVTDLIGMGVNMVTGQYSRGAAGFWIEGGELVYPVSEITVAGSLLDMFASLRVADDLEFRYGVDAPTLALEGLTVGGRAA